MNCFIRISPLYLLPIVSLSIVSCVPASAAILNVGPAGSYATPCQAIAAAAAGDTIQIDAAGNYAGDVCGWSKNNLTLIGVNGRPHIDAAGANYGGKGIWVISGNDTIVDNVELSGATVVDGNGAGIRMQGRNLTIRRSYFHNNQDGLLTGDSAAGSILIEYSEFAYNGNNDGQTHNIYVSHVGRFTMRYSYSHHALQGQLVKSRAAENYILYNRLTTEATGTTSYEVDLSNGGDTYLIGNVIEQGPVAPNESIVAYMLEGPNAANPGHNLFLINNTIVNDRTAGGIFVNIYTGDTTPAVLKNNIFYGPGTITTQASAVTANNFTGNPLFVDAAHYDYHLQAGSPAIDQGANPGTGPNGYSLLPGYQYVHPECDEFRATVGTIDIGAYEFGGGSGASGGCAAPPSPALALVAASPASIGGGATTTGNLVTLDSPAPAGGAVAALSSSSPGVAGTPASVTIPEHLTSAAFPIQTSPVGISTPVMISASDGNATRTTTLTVTPGGVVGLTASPASISAGQTSTGTVALNVPAPAGGVTISLSNSNPAAATVPASVTIPAGASSTTFTIQGANVATAASATITVSYAGSAASATVSVSPMALLSVTVATPVAGGTSTAANQVTLSGAAPSGGATIYLTSSAPSVASVPASIVIPAGATSATFPISTSAVTANASAVISAAYSGATKSATLTVTAVNSAPSTAATLATVALSPTVTGGGNTTTYNTVKLYSAAPAGGAVIALSSSTSYAVVPSTVTVAAGSTTATFPITTKTVTASTVAVISATYAGVTRTASLTVTPVSVSSLSLYPTTVIGGASTTSNSVILNAPAPAGGAVVRFSSSSAAATLPASVTIPAGAKSAVFTIQTSGVSATTSAAISATCGGVTKTATLTVNP